MTGVLSRLFKPRSIAVIGGGAWCTSIITAAEQIGYAGEIIPVHPEGKCIAGRASVTSLTEIGAPVDAAFIGVNREATLRVVKDLSKSGAGGAVCFASGFSEAEAELGGARELQAALITAAGNMPILGPNCYGFINALDRCAIWPDQHGCAPVERGVAILAQSSNIAINLTMQRRALPIGYMITCGNMAQTSQAQIALELLDDPRVTAIGLHIEGFGNTAQWHALAQKAEARGIPLIALKVGSSAEAQAATISHTASLAGSDAGAEALLARLGIARARDLPSFLEALKLFHLYGRLTGPTLATLSCSGGEAALAADLAQAAGLSFPPLTPEQTRMLSDALGPKVALANPLDYHTYIWRDVPRMSDVFTAQAAGTAAISLAIVDYPHTDASDWSCVTEAALAAKASAQRPFGAVSTLPELMPRDVAERFMAAGVAPLMGLAEAIEAIRLASAPRSPSTAPPLACPPLPASAKGATTLSEHEAKGALAAHGICVPKGRQIAKDTPLEAALHGLEFPLALKAEGLAHKSESGGVALGLSSAEEVRGAQVRMGGESWLLEEMATGALAELLIGVVRDAAHGFVLTLAAGGVHAELFGDSVALLLPVTKSEVNEALNRLNMAPLLAGYRGKPAAKRSAILSAVMALQDYVIAHQGEIVEVEVNPLICTAQGAIAADALIRKASS